MVPGSILGGRTFTEVGRQLLDDWVAGLSRSFAIERLRIIIKEKSRGGVAGKAVTTLQPGDLAIELVGTPCLRSLGPPRMLSTGMHACRPPLHKIIVGHVPSRRVHRLKQFNR